MYKINSRLLEARNPTRPRAESSRIRKPSPRYLFFTILALLGALLNPDRVRGDIFSNPEGIRAYSHVSKSIAKEIDWGPADYQDTQRFFRLTLAQYACGCAVSDSMTIFALDVPDSLGRFVSIKFLSQSETQGRLLCKIGPPFVVESIPENSYLTFVPRRVKIDSVLVKLTSGRNEVLRRTQ